MKEQMCSAINHPWQIKPPIYVLKNGNRRVRLECNRCGGLRYDTRSSNGAALVSRTYDHSTNYDKFLIESRESKNRRSDAWVSVIGDTKEIKSNERDNTTLRLVHNKAKKVRRHKPKPRQRDKKWHTNT